MKLYRTRKGVIIQENENYYLLSDLNWDELINNDDLLLQLREMIDSDRVKIVSFMKEEINNILLSPVGAQELWASGVTYIQSREGRKEESAKQGGGSFYERVYEADRPELFFKSMGYRTVGSGENIRIRRDSKWNVPEPELTVLATKSGKIVGYTIGNDMSSRSIEGENPLYLPQAKIYDGSAAVGPCILITDSPLSTETKIEMKIFRSNENVFRGEVLLSNMRRKLTELISWLYRELTLPNGCFLMSGTGIVPPKNFSLNIGDRVEITIDGIGSLINNIE